MRPGDHRHDVGGRGDRRAIFRSPMRQRPHYIPMIASVGLAFFYMR